MRKIAREIMPYNIKVAYERLDRAIKAIDPIAVFGLFSGGHDSFSSTFIASHHPAFTAAVNINTGIGIEATRQYVRDTCEAREWPLLEYRAEDNALARTGEPDPQIYDDLVRAYGFPGPAHHAKMYNRLKERQLRRLERDFGATPKRRVIYVSGCRTQESDRRMANTEELQIDGRRAWCAPIHDCDKCDTSDILCAAKQPRNLVVDLIHKSGECLCGAFAKPGELSELNQWDITRPAYTRIVSLQNEVAERFGRGWGERPFRDNQTIVSPGMLCWSCDKAV